MNNKIKDILVGCLLDDVHIEKSGENKAYITFEQTIKT